MSEAIMEKALKKLSGDVKQAKSRIRRMIRSARPATEEDKSFSAGQDETETNGRCRRWLQGVKTRIRQISLRSMEDEEEECSNLQSGAPTPNHIMTGADTGVSSDARLSTDADANDVSNAGKAASCLRALEDLELLETLRQAVVEHREIQVRESGYEAELERLYGQYTNLQDSIIDFNTQIETCDAESFSPDKPSVYQLQEQLVGLEKQQAAVVDEMKRADSFMVSSYHSHLRRQQPAFSVLDAIFVKNTMLDPRPDGNASNASRSQASSVASSQRAVDHGSSIGATSSRNAIANNNSVTPQTTNSEHTTHKSVGVANMTSTNPDKHNELPELKARFTKACHRLDVAEDAFDEREERRDRAVALRARRIADGDAVETQSEFDVDQLKQVQCLAHEIIEAELAVEDAKAEAAFHHVQLYEPWEKSSEFADDPDDGYKISFEDDMAATIDPARIYRWLNKVEENGLPDEPQSLAEVEIDDWEAQSVDISDSKSMLAYGREKRWIDKWRAMRELMQVDARSTDL